MNSLNKIIGFQVGDLVQLASAHELATVGVVTEITQLDHNGITVYSVKWDFRWHPLLYPADRLRLKSK